MSVLKTKEEVLAHFAGIAKREKIGEEARTDARRDAEVQRQVEQERADAAHARANSNARYVAANARGNGVASAAGHVDNAKLDAMLSDRTTPRAAREDMTARAHAANSTQAKVRDDSAPAPRIAPTMSEAQADAAAARRRFVERMAKQLGKK